jgi:predicted DNA-binding transcriptional regulator YafY
VTDTAGRLLRLLPLLTTRPSWRGEKLAARLGVTTRTVRRDIGRLRELGYPVRAIPGPQGGYALGPGASLPPLLLDDYSAVAVALGLRAAAADPELRGMEEAASRAAAAMDQVMPPRLRRRVEALTAATVTLATAEPAIEPDVLALLALACAHGERLRFGYLNGAGADSRRHAEPYRLVSTGTWSRTTWTRANGGRSAWTGCVTRGPPESGPARLTRRTPLGSSARGFPPGPIGGGPAS